MRKTFLKSKIAFLLATVITVTSVLSGCGSLSGASGYVAKNFRGTRAITISSKKLNMYIDTGITCSFGDYFNDKFDFAKESAALRQFCFVSLMDAHDVGVVSFKDKPNTDETNNTMFLEEMGFVNVEQTVVGSGAATDTDDTAAMVISHKYVGTATNGAALFFLNVSLCGTQGSSEWKSNFDFGSDTDDYTGDHPDWQDKDNHKGFDVAASRVIDAINTYIYKNKSMSKGKVVVAVSGYSHGAAVANLVGAKIADDDNELLLNNYDVVTYTFATPRTTLKDSYNNSKYNTIHNYYNEDDVVANLPTTAMGYRRYGQDHPYSIQNDETKKTNFNNQVDAINAKNGNNKATYYDASCAPTVIEALNNLLSNRNDVYTIIEDEAHMTVTLGASEDYVSVEEAQQAGNDFLAAREADSVGQYFKDAGITEGKMTSRFVETEDGLVDMPMPSYVWHCYVGDGILVDVFNTVISSALSGNASKAMKKQYLIGYSRHSENFNIILGKLSSNTSYFGNAHNPLATYMGCIN